MPTVARNTFYLTLALIGQKILSFIYFTLLARFLGAEIIGKYSFALAFTVIFSVVTDLGLTPVLIREIARAKEKAEQYIRTVITLKIILGLVAYVGVLTTVYLLGHPPLTLQLIALAGVVMFFDAFHLSFYGVMRGFQNLKYESIGMVFGQLITLIAGSIALVLHLPLHMFLVALGLGSIWNVGLSFLVLRRNHISVRPCINRDIMRIFIRYAIPFALAGIFVKVYSSIDIVLLQHIKGDLEVGWYSVPYKITYAFQFLPLALSAAVYPALANTWKQDKVRSRWIYDRALLYSILFSLPIAFGISALAPEIMKSIYGTEFINSILPLKISIFGLIFLFLYYPVGALLNATDRQKINTTFMGLTMLINIVINLALIPLYGAVGASIAAVLTNAFLFFSTFIWSATFMRPSAIVIKTFFKTLIAALAMFTIVLYVKSIMLWPLSILVGAAAYGLLIYFFRALTREDVKKLLQLLKKEPIDDEHQKNINPNKIIQY